MFPVRSMNQEGHIGLEKTIKSLENLKRMRKNPHPFSCLISALFIFNFCILKIADSFFNRLFPPRFSAFDGRGKTGSRIVDTVRREHRPVQSQYGSYSAASPSSGFSPAQHKAPGSIAPPEHPEKMPERFPCSAPEKRDRLILGNGCPSIESVRQRSF